MSCVTADPGSGRRLILVPRIVLKAASLSPCLTSVMWPELGVTELDLRFCSEFIYALYTGRLGLVSKLELRAMLLLLQNELGQTQML